MDSDPDGLELTVEEPLAVVSRWQPRPSEPLAVVERVGGRPCPFAVYLSLRAVEAILAGLPEGQRVEAGGLLVGHSAMDAAGEYLLIAGAVPAVLAEGKRLCLTFTHEAWDALLAAQEQLFPQERIIGWYHTHPGLGVFLSGPDLFIHRHFFAAPEQVALVIDTDSFTWGLFFWAEDQIQVAAGFHLYGEPVSDYGRLAELLALHAAGGEMAL